MEDTPLTSSTRWFRPVSSSSQVLDRPDTGKKSRWQLSTGDVLFRAHPSRSMPPHRATLAVDFYLRPPQCVKIAHDPCHESPNDLRQSNEPSALPLCLGITFLKTSLRPDPSALGSYIWGEGFWKTAGVSIREFEGPMRLRDEGVARLHSFQIREEGKKSSFQGYGSWLCRRPSIGRWGLGELECIMFRHLESSNEVPGT